MVQIPMALSLQLENPLLLDSLQKDLTLDNFM
jgi:hypothetical protein